MKKTMIKQKIKEALTKSTSHGIPNIAGSDSLTLKIFWVLFTLAATGLCAYLIAQNIMGFYDYDVTTKIRTKYELNFTFPSVTVCNLNFFTTEYAYEFLNQSFEKTLEIDLAIKNAENLTELQKYGDSLEKLVISFSYLDTITDIWRKEDYFTYFFHPSFGNCYTFNSNKGNNNSLKNPLNSLKSGFISGLQIDLNISFYPNLSLSLYGAMVFVHEFGSSPLSVDGIAIFPEQMTLVALQRTRSKQLPKPYSDCEETDNFESDLVNDIKKMNYKYTQKLCFSLCLHRLMLQNCSCYSTDYSLFTEGEPCVEFDKMICVMVFYFSFVKYNYLIEKCRPNCPLECETITYTKTISTHINGYKTLVKIYFENFAITEIDESAVTTVEVLLSNIGGIAGLFLGISVLSFIEIPAVLIDIILFILKNENKVIDEKSNTEKSELDIKSI